VKHFFLDQKGFKPELFLVITGRHYLAFGLPR